MNSNIITIIILVLIIGVLSVVVGIIINRFKKWKTSVNAKIHKLEVQTEFLMKFHTVEYKDESSLYPSIMRSVELTDQKDILWYKERQKELQRRFKSN